MADYSRHSCFDGSHFHLTHSELATHRRRNLVFDLRIAKTSREKTVVQIQILAERDTKWAGRQLSTYAMAGEPMNKGLSFRIGPYLAKHVRQNHSWAIVMFSQINRPRAQREMAEEETIERQGAIECSPA